MTLAITYTPPGRGAWSSKGGTLNLAGDGPGMNFRSATGKSKVIGVDVRAKHRDLAVHAVHIDEVAVWRAAMALQKALNAQKVAPALDVDGQWGPITDSAARAYQTKAGIKVDGVVGPQTCRALFTPMLAARCDHIPFLVDLCSAKITLESGWDPAAVGVTTPKDLGISQINTAAHPSMTWETAFDPDLAFDFKLRLIKQNLAAFKDRAPRDRIILATVAYNGGVGGATSWDRAGRPGFGTGWGTPDDWAPSYLRAVARNATDPTLVQALAPWKD